jgi:signal transduction histidine kinase/CheY-like chemotaxis protein
MWLNKFLGSRIDHVRDFFVTQSEEVEVKQIEIAFLATTKNLSAGILAVVILFFGIWNLPSRSVNQAIFPYLLTWACVAIFFLGRGIYLAVLFKRPFLTNEAQIHLGRRLATNGAIMGFLWGSSSFLIVGSTDIQQSTFLVCTIGLVILGGTGAQAQYGRLVTWFVCSTTTMFVVGILVNPLFPNLMGFGFILYATVALMSARQQQTSVKQIIELNLKNQDLLRQTRESMLALDQARAAAESANRAKTRFLAATSHDLRQPMHALSLFVAHLRLCRNQQELMDTLEKADSALEAMKNLLNAVLDLSRISLGTIKPEIRSVHLDEVLQRVRMQLQPQADEKGLRLVVDRAYSFVKTDPVLLERIFGNIIANAIRYTTIGMVTVRVTRRGDNIDVRVADTGIGIPKSERTRVFEEFYQVENPERDRHKGLGLGLAIVAQLGTLLTHPISFRSRLGRGTIFRVRLDACADMNESTASSGEMAGDDFVTGCAVLVIDDDQLVLDSMALTLRDLGCHVIVADGYLQALENLGGEARIPDIIISDYRLRRGETGITVIRTLREKLHGEEHPELPVPGLILSGDTSPEEIAAVSREGLLMLHKPLTPTVLQAKMNELLGIYSRTLCGAIDRKP